MKLKYYLRGLGMGIIFATSIMFVAILIHKVNPSQETIIKEALKLGMIMPDKTEDENLFGGTENESQNSESQNSESQNNESQNSDSQGEETSSDETQNSEGVNNENPNSEDPNNGDSNSEAEREYVTIEILRTDFARQVGQKLYDLGVVQDAEHFRLYLGETGYDIHIKSGTFQIPKDATYEEILSIIIYNYEG